MRAIRVSEFGESSVMNLSTVDPPSLQNERQVVVQVKAAGVNPVDTYWKCWPMSTWGTI